MELGGSRVQPPAGDVPSANEALPSSGGIPEHTIVPSTAVTSGPVGPSMTEVDSALPESSIGREDESDYVEEEEMEEGEGVREDYDAPHEPSIYDFQVLDCYRELYDLSQHRGMPLLIVNVASTCSKYSEAGYRLLCTLYERYREYGFNILAFPCTQFGNTEPFNAEDIETEVPKLYPNSVKSIDFPIMCKVDVNGECEIPLYGYLKSCLKGGVGQSAINWNFTYFLVNGDGIPVLRLGPETKLEQIERPLRHLLGFEDE